MLNSKVYFKQSYMIKLNSSCGLVERGYTFFLSLTSGHKPPVPSLVLALALPNPLLSYSHPSRKLIH